MSTERDHLDAETVAAWIDGGLDAASLAAAEAHASNCERCQALLATLVKTEPVAAPGLSPGISGATSLWKWWMAPIAAAAAAVTLWMVVPQEQVRQIATAPPAVTEPAAQPVDQQAKRQPPAKVDDFAEVQPKARDEAPAAQEKARVAQAKPETAANVPTADAAGRRDNKEERPARLEAEAARAPAAPAPVARAAEAAPGAPAEFTQLRKQFAPLVFVSPDPRFRWRVSADGIERSEDSGRSWFVVRLPQGEVITAGASPAPLVCWLVGRRGLVLIATDGTNFTPLPFPEPVDLTAVSSPNVLVATVTTADGRVFRTENSGRDWRRQK